MRRPYDSLHSFLTVFRREWLRMCSRPIYFYCIIVAPLVCLLFFTSLMKEGLPSRLPVAVVDLDRSATSRNAIRTFASMQQVGAPLECSSFSEARDALQRGQVYGILLIPAHFAEDLQAFRQPKLSYYTSYTYLIPGSLLYSNMRKLTELISGAALRSQLRARGATEDQVLGYVQPIVIESHALFNPSLNYSIYLTNLLLPGVLMLLISIMTVYVVGSEVKENTARFWLERGNHSILLSLTAKLLPYTLVFFVIGMACDVYLYLILDYPCHCGMPAVLFLTLCMVLAAQGLGLLFFALVPTLRMALSLTCLWGVVSFSICGMSFPYAAMSAPIKALSHLFPLRYYYLVYVARLLDGHSFLTAWEGYLGLFAFMLLPLLFLLRLKRELIHTDYIP